MTEIMVVIEETKKGIGVLLPLPAPSGTKVIIRNLTANPLTVRENAGDAMIYDSVESLGRYVFEDTHD